MVLTRAHIYAGGTGRHTGWGAALLALGLLLGALLLVWSASVPVRAQDRQPPYWASINRPEAIMRRGPSTLMPAMWEYRRMGLPLRIVAVRGDWRQVEDPGGVVGWMHKRLLTGRRTAIVTAAVRPMRIAPDASAAIAYRAEPGVVGQLGECRGGWCELDVGGRSGWIAADHIWGDGPA